MEEFIFITHDHYDHYSEDDIDKIRKEDTILLNSHIECKILI